MAQGLKRTIKALLIAGILYSLLGFLILPGVALRIANQQLAQHAAVPASIERLQFNPFSLELSLWGLSLGQPESPDISAKRISVNLAADSLWSRTLHLSAVELDSAKVSLDFAKNGALNLAQLFKQPTTQADKAPVETAESSTPFPLRIDNLQLIHNALSFADQRPSTPVRFAYDDLNLELHNLSTLADENSNATLQARGPNGSSLNWQGQLSITPLFSSGTLSLEDVHLESFWPYVRDAVALELKQGELALSTDYVLDLRQGTQLILSKLNAELSPLALDDAQQKPLVRLERLTISDASFDLAKQHVHLKHIASQALNTWVVREKDGLLNWQTLITSQSATSEEKPAAQQSKPWQIKLGELSLHNSQIQLTDKAAAQPVELEVGPLNASLKDFNSLGTTPFTLTLETGLGKTGQLNATGSMQLEPVSADFKLTTKDINLRLAQAYLQPFVRLELRSGLLSSDLNLKLTSTEPLAFSVSGNAAIDQLHTLDTLRERDLLRWKQVQINDLNYQHQEHLKIGKIDLQQPYVRFVINENLTTNISELIVPQPPSTTPSTPDKALPIYIGGISINDGSANFADFSLTPNFATAIQQMNGQIGVLDNQKNQAAKINITGKVDRYAPMSITGQLTPFDPLNSLDIKTRFENVELTTATPYSGKFAGYRIRKGRLNLDLHYRIEDGQLDAQNKVVVENLQLGEKVDSPDAVNLPIRLAVALLKDAQGNISLELPVSGNLNDPQFSVMPIIFKTLSNLVVRAAQAPFNFIAGLVSSSDVDLSEISFNAGSAELDDQARSTLNTSASALKERPALSLEVEGQSAKTADGLLLAEQRLEREYRENWYKLLQRRGDKVPASPSELNVADDEKAALLEGIYRARLKQQPPAQWQELSQEQRLSQMRQAVIESWAGSSSLLRQLAQQRAGAIKQHLVEQGLADERIYLIDAGITEAASDGRVSSTLHLDSL